MRVLHAISGIDPGNGGPTVALHGLGAAQVALGNSVTIVATWQHESGRDNAAKFRERGMDVEMIGPARGKLSTHPSIAPTLKSLVERHDVVHIHAVWEEIQHIAAECARAAERPYVWRPCGLLMPTHMKKSYWAKRAVVLWRTGLDLSQANAIHFASDHERDETRTWLKEDQESIVEPNGINLDEFSNNVDPNEIRRIIPQIGNRRVVLFLARPAREKGLDLLIPAFVRAKLENHVLVIVGHDPQRTEYLREIETLISKLHARDRVILAGAKHGAEKLACYRGAEVFALTSHFESFGNVVIEALAAGTPVIVTRGVGLSREVERGEVGLVVDHTIESISAAIEKICNDPTLRAQFASRARPFVENRFTWPSI
ncbi:MAG TPA: glycosyltransferase, partial [Tepidisphaeraceae bacterium]|nr:glycosyltransferase [Tepidisphaeraceae bacterium]